MADARFPAQKETGETDYSISPAS